ncbi:MAG: hypothetical protein ACK4IY_00780 [Chitinophagales bacterium]
MQQGGFISRIIACTLRPAILFIFYYVITLLLYYQTIGARLATDALNWLIAYETQGFTGILNSFGDVSQHYSYHLLFYLSYLLFGTNETGYFYLFSLIHASNATLLYIILKKYLTLLSVKNFSFAALVASLLFLLNPYQTEAVVWGATIHYLTTTLIFLLIWQTEISQREKQLLDTNNWTGWLLFLFAVYLHLTAATIPFILYLLLLPVFNFRWAATCKKLAPYFGILLFYTLSNAILFGTLTGHISGYTDSSPSPLTILGNLNKYVAKDFFLIHFFPYDTRDAIYTFGQTATAIAALCILLTALVFQYLRWQNKHRGLWTLGLVLIIFSIALIPSAALYFYYLTPIESDRLTYFALLFSSAFLGILFSLFPRRIAFIAASTLIAIYAVMLMAAISAWNDAAKVTQSTENTFPQTQTGKIYLLNVPDNIRGAYLFREGRSESKLMQSLQFKHNQTSQSAEEVMQFNMQKITDGVRVEKVNDNTLKIMFAQYGNWWWMDGKGATDYADENKEVHITDNGMAYTVYFKNKMPDDIFVYLHNNTWHVLDNF